MTKLNKKIALTLLSLIVCVAVSVIVLRFGAPLTARAATEATPYSVTEQTGLGLAINVVTAEHANDFTTAHSVLTPSKIPQLPSSKVTLNENKTYNYSTSNVEELIESFNLKFGIGAEVGIFIASLSSNLQLAGNFAYQNYSYKHFSMLEHKISRYNLFIDEYANPSTYANCFSSEYLNDLNNLKTNKDYNSFFAKYGTHIVGSAIYGGRLYATYSLVSTNTIINSDAESVIQNAVSFDNLSSNTFAGIKQDLASNMHIGTTQSDLQYGFHVDAVGGNAFSSSSINTFSSGRASWTNSFNSDDSNSVIIDFTNGGLVPLWDILPSQYSSLASDMQNAFKNYYQDNANNVVKEFKAANHKEFNGGTGTAADPFLISKELQLINIENVSMKAHYQLSNDIYLSTDNWVPIGGFYKDDEEKETRFEGAFDGKGYTISNLKRTSDIAEKNSRIYFGLFCCIGENGVVKNVNLKDCNIYMTGPKVNNSNTRVFIGALAGAVYGTVSNVTVTGECYNSQCTNGVAYFGGIAGVAKGAYISNCVNKANITSGRYVGVAGGIVANAIGGTISGCTNYGTITTYGTAWGGRSSAGGIVGDQYKYMETRITDCTNKGSRLATDYGGALSCKKYSKDLCAYDQNEIYE